MKNPNGYGCITKLGGTRRKPYAVRITSGYDLRFKDGLPQSTQKRKYLGFYATKKEALQALADFHKHPDCPERSDITFAEVFEKWILEKCGEEKDAKFYSYSAAFRKLVGLHHKEMRKIKTADIEREFIGNYSSSTYNNMIIVISQAFEWCIKYDICEKNYAEYIKKPAAKPKGEKNIFTDDEIYTLWQHTEDLYAAVALMLIYSGLRIGEFIALTAADIHLDKQYLDIKQAKTAAGVRIVPIADRTLPLWRDYVSKGCTLKHSRPVITQYWHRTLGGLGIDHTPHETRHTCVSLLTVAGVRSEIIKKIVGHKGGNVTEDTYLHLQIDELLTAINSI